MILFEDGFYFLILKSFAHSTLEAIGFLPSYMSQFEGKSLDLLVIKSIMEEDHSHDPGMKCKKIAVNKYFVILFFKGTGSLL